MHKPAQRRGGKPPRPPPIYTWISKSQRGTLGGDTCDFLTRLHRDGTVDCNCPGWRFKRKDQPLWCSHWEKHRREVPALMKAYREGKLPKIEEPTPPKKTDPIYGRNIQL